MRETSMIMIEMYWSTFSPP